MPDASLSNAPLLVARLPILPLNVGLEAFAIPYDNLRTYIFEFLSKQPYVRSAIAVASPSLSKQLDDHLASQRPISEGVLLKLLAYIIRSSTRSTPFGMFSGISLLSTSNDGLFRRLSAINTKSRPDSSWLLAFLRRYDRLEHYPHLKLSLNKATIYISDRITIFDARRVVTSSNNGSEYQQFVPTSIRATEPVRFLTDSLHDDLTVENLSLSLMSNFDVSRPDALSLLQNLYDVGFFISELRPSPFQDPLAQTIGVLDRVDPTVAQALSTLQSKIDAWDSIDFCTRNRSNLSIVLDCQRAISTAEQINLQVDTHIKTNGHIPDFVLRDVEQLADFAIRMKEVQDSFLLRNSFARRFEGTDRLVPLLNLLNPEMQSWSEYSESPLIASNDDAIRIQSALSEMIYNATANRAREIILTVDNIDNILYKTPSRDECPTSIEIGFDLIARSSNQLNAGIYSLVFGKVASDHAGKTIGRFMHLFNPVERETIATTIKVGNGNSKTAEIANLPNGNRTMNVLIRECTADYVVATDVHLASTHATNIPLDDLFVGIDGKRFFIWCRSLQCEIVFSELDMLIASKRSPLVALLTMLSNDAKAPVSFFQWGSFKRFPFLPRIRFDRLILSPARWRFSRDKDALKTIFSARADGKIDRYVWMRDSRNDRLLTDLDTDVGRRLLTAQVKAQKASEIFFEETLFEDAESWIRDEQQSSYAAEFVASVFFPGATRPQIAIAEKQVFSTEDRVIPPGSDWLYLKAYCAPASIDYLLATHIDPLISRLRDDGWEGSWFFIRYQDPLPHIRLRIGNASSSIQQQCLDFFGVLVKQGLLNRIVIDTYERELERYGGVSAMREIEKLFSYSSEVAIQATVASLRDPMKRVRELIETFEPIRNVLTNNDTAWLEMNKSFNIKLSKDEWDIVREISLSERPMPHVFNKHLHALRGLADGGQLTVSTESILSSLLHMHCNRFGLPDESRARAIQFRCVSKLRALQAQRVT